MTEDDKKKMLENYDLFVADDITLIIAAGVISQALEANDHIRVPIVEMAFDGIPYAKGDGDTIKTYLKTLANMPTPIR